ncbi:MAG: TetR/AcrR family transcriptional regulator [Betaproteobacteria bacterium]|nr:TetR/AcrR family transcriptional regulator [Betaproteobacteria bacterium]
MNTPAKVLEPRWERRKDARPGELVDAALDLFIEKGFAATRLEDVAKRAGVSKGTLYLYFDSKEDLLKAAIREGYAEPLRHGEQVLATFQGSSADLLRMILKMWWEEVGATKQAGLTKLVIGESQNFPELARFYHDEVIQRAHKLVSGAIDRGIQSGEFRAVNLPYAQRVACAPMVLLMLWKHSFACCVPNNVDPQEYVATHADMLIHALKNPAALNDAPGKK